MAVTHLADDLGSVPAHGLRGSDELFELLAQLGVAPVDLLSGNPLKELIASLSDAIGSSVDLVQQIVGKVDLDPGHVASIGCGFG
jgi:hypothetical protein